MVAQTYYLLGLLFRSMGCCLIGLQNPQMGHRHLAIYAFHHLQVCFPLLNLFLFICRNFSFSFRNTYPILHYSIINFCPHSTSLPPFISSLISAYNFGLDLLISPKQLGEDITYSCYEQKLLQTLFYCTYYLIRPMLCRKRCPCSIRLFFCVFLAVLHITIHGQLCPLIMRW